MPPRAAPLPPLKIKCNAAPPSASHAALATLAEPPATRAPHGRILALAKDFLTPHALRRSIWNETEICSFLPSTDKKPHWDRCPKPRRRSALLFLSTKKTQICKRTGGKNGNRHAVGCAILSNGSPTLLSSPSRTGLPRVHGRRVVRGNQWRGSLSQSSPPSRRLPEAFQTMSLYARQKESFLGLTAARCRVPRRMLRNCRKPTAPTPHRKIRRTQRPASLRLGRSAASAPLNSGKRCTQPPIDRSARGPGRFGPGMHSLRSHTQGTHPPAGSARQTCVA